MVTSRGRGRGKGEVSVSMAPPPPPPPNLISTALTKLVSTLTAHGQMLKLARACLFPCPELKDRRTTHSKLSIHNNANFTSLRAREGKRGRSGYSRRLGQ